MGGECSLMESDVVWQDGNNAWFEAEPRGSYSSGKGYQLRSYLLGVVAVVS